MPSRRVGRPLMVVATLIAFSVITLVFVGEGCKAFLRKDGASLGRRDFTFGLHWQSTMIPTTAGEYAVPANVDCPHQSTIAAMPSLADNLQIGNDAVEAGSTMVSAILAQGTNTVSLSLQGKSDMVSVILANINGLVSHPTGDGKSTRDATGLLAIAMGKPKPNALKTAAPSIATSLESTTSFELIRKAAEIDGHSHSEDCDCAACNSSPAHPTPITVAPSFPTHQLVARQNAATVTVTVSACPDSSANGPASNSTASSGNNPAPAPVPDSASNSSMPASSDSSPSSNAPGSASIPSAPDSSNTSPSSNAPFANNTDSGSGSGSGAGSGAAAGSAGSAAPSSPIANAAPYLMGSNSSQPTANGNAQPSDTAAGPPSSATSAVSPGSPAANSAPASVPTISPPIASQASGASSVLDNNIIIIIAGSRYSLVGFIYGMANIVPIAFMFIVGQVWLL